MDKDQLDGLLALKLVAETRNFTAAAGELGISPSAISRMIKQLENRLGAPLLTRTTRSTGLTEAGERFLAVAAPAIDDILTAMAGVGTYAKKPSGLLKLSLSRSFFPTLVAPLITSFMKKYPEVTVELLFDDELSDIVGRGIDAGIRSSETVAKDMVAMKLAGPVRFVTAASPRYFKANGRPKHPKDLLSHNCIRIRFGDHELYDRWEFESRGQEFQVHVNGSLILNDTLLAANAALDGLGILYYAEELIKDRIASGKLEVVLDQFSPTISGFYLYYPKRSQVLPKLRAFIEHVLQERKATSCNRASQ